MPSSPSESIYEWRVVYTQQQVAGIPAGTYSSGATTSEDNARERLAHYQGLGHVTEAHLERRRPDWERVDEPDGPQDVRSRMGADWFIDG